jgi:hypothetical protein
MEAAKGNITTNVLTHLGRFGIDPTKAGNIATLVPVLAAGGGYASGNLTPSESLALVAAGTAAKFGGRKMQVGLANRAKDVVMAGKDAQKKAFNTARQARLQSRYRALLLAGKASQPAVQPDGANR